jgi:simple sugar transport system ATP-binding protein
MGSLVKNNSFSIYGGQVTGVFGLVGSGRTESAKIIAGVSKRNFFYGGEVFLEDRPVRYRLPRAAMKDGVVYVTEDRKIEGLFEQKTISENIAFGELAAGLRKSWVVSNTKVLDLAREWSRKLNIKSVKGESAKAVELSGGNQQKVVIAKSLVQAPKVIIFDEPTRGVDVGAIAEIHQLINALADQGMAIMVISSYLPEIMHLSDRILVMRLGRIVEEFSPGEASEERIMYAAVH